MQSGGNLPPPSVSGSMSTESTSQAIDVTKTNGFVDELFPLFTSVFQQVSISLFFVFPFLFFFFTQVITTSIWPWSRYWEKSDSKNITWYLRSILFFLPPDAAPMHYLVVTVVIFALNLLAFIIIRFQLAYYKVQRSFIKALNVPIRFFIDTFNLVLIVPATVIIGESFLKIAHGVYDYQYIVSLIFNMISLFYLIFTFTITQGFASKSISISNSLLLNFDPSVMIITIAMFLTCQLLYFILALFESWARLVAIGLHIICFSYILYYICARMPFVILLSTALSVSWFIGNIFGDILSIIAEFYQGLNEFIVLGIVYGFFLLTSPAFLMLFGIKIKKIVGLLQEDIKGDQNREDYFTDLGLADNEVKAMLFLRLGFQNYCPMFYNWSLINFIMNHHQNEEALSTCLQIINFFPKEGHLSNRLQRLVLQSRTITYPTRFLLFQIEHIKTLRQFSVSTAAKIKLLELKTMSKQCEMMTKGAVDSTKLTPAYFENMSTRTRLTRAIWREALEMSPNNPKFCEEFAKYLIESETDFISGIRIKHRQNVIEMGTSFSVDYSFRSMVREFPGYLKKHIVDLKGGVVDNTKMKNTKGSQSLSNQSSNGSSGDISYGSKDNGETELDNEVEEYVGKQSISHAKIRLALQRALETKIPFSIKIIIPATIITIVLLTIIFILGFAFSILELSGQTQSMTRLDCISQTRFYTSLGDVDLILRFSQEHNELQKYLEEMQVLVRNTDPVFINVDRDMLREILTFTNNASQKFQELIDNIAELALDGEDIFSFADTLLRPNVDMTSCGYFQISRYKASVSELMSMYIFHQREFSGKDTVYNLMRDENYCEVFVNFETLYKAGAVLFDKLSQYQKDKSHKLKNLFNNLAIAIPVITFFVGVVPIIAIHISNYLSLRNIIEIIHSFDNKAKQEAKQPLTFGNNDDDIKFAEMNATSNTSIILICVIVFISLAFLAVSLIMCVLVVKSNNNIIKLNDWNRYASLRLSLSAESLMVLIFSVANHDIPDSQVFKPVDYLVNLTLKITKELVDADMNLTQGTEDSPACNGFDRELDEYNIIDQQARPKIGDPHDFYSKTSIHQQIEVYNEFIRILSDDALKMNEPITKFYMANSLHIVNAHMWMRLMNVTKRMIKLAEIEYTNLVQSIIIMAVVVVLLIISFICVMVFYYINRLSTYKASLFVLRRFHPLTLINNKLFAKFFLKSKDLSHNEHLTVDGSIIHNVNDAIFCTSYFGTVETVNTSVSTLLGYTPEQILGQSVNSFFSTQDEEKLQTKLEMMKNGQSSTFVEEDMTVVSDSAKEIPCHVTIIGMKNNNGDLNSFVIILRDQTALVNQMKQAEDAKAKSEKLLYQILPRDIVVQLNKGEKDISFTVESATIIFIDIVKFSEYTVNLSPQEIMANLSTYFANIDKLASKHNMITKIKLIGDIYMAAAGLFNPEASPESHAEQAINLGLESIQELEEVNMRLDASLTIRVGVNTGGPLIAGVLGTDKPAFDIIGDPINVAAILQSTDEPNHVHISQATYDIIKCLDFDVIARGETFLKGKGKQMTYFVNPVAQTTFNGTGSFMKQ
ncbi:Adenylate and Guanylate cyclase catalytic domain containing protein [Trichomonas vaginalis G3]|uniref:Adenylate and Guanylate cyclase catalytic domain containing protein n=1 Tax=Trichomonas vaginalis (strain ATCC PRA-98 / G3) TaxID=412133 RepID=A2G4Y5_TRIV3|nr:Adenylate and Guanylate cyclase catalytic domain containing protein [Trichomonas vaginalis G3]|eukprot:XP_001300716.1 Adenylate and Guanylate cyclase catalytic domain containing protein [Trichomonas vaginalis G3]